MSEASTPVEVRTRTKCRHCGSSLIMPDSDGRRYCLLCCRPYTDWQGYGALGGQATLARYGREHFVSLGRRGGRPRLRQLPVPEVQSQLKGGNRLPNRLSELKGLWRERREELFGASSSSQEVT